MAKTKKFLPLPAVVVRESPAELFIRQEKEDAAEAHRRAMDMSVPKSLAEVLTERKFQATEIKHLLKMASEIATSGAQDDPETLCRVSYAIDGTIRLMEQLAEGLDDYALFLAASKLDVANEREAANA